MLPASSQFEKVEATYFNLEFPRNAFHLRHPVIAPLPGHARRAGDPRAPRRGDGRARPTPTTRRCAPRPPRGAWRSRARSSRPWRANPRVAKYAPVVLYRTLGPTLPEGLAGAADLLGLRASVRAEEPRRRRARRLRRRSVHRRREALRRDPLEPHRRRLLRRGRTTRAGRASACPSGASTSRSPSSIGELEKLAAGPRPRDATFPFILSAGERRSDTTNTIIRNPASLAKERRRDAAHERRRRASGSAVADGERRARDARGAAAPRCPSR